MAVRGKNGLLCGLKWRVVCSLGLLCAAFAAFGQKAITAYPYPMFYYTPETRFVGGVGLTGTYRYNSDTTNSRPSSILAGLAYSQNKQAMIYLQFQTFYDNDRFYGYGEAGYYRYNYFFWGVGQDEIGKTLYAVNYPRLRLNMAMRTLPRLYIGSRYVFEDYRIKDTATSGPFYTGDVPGAKGSRVSGTGILAIYDSRDTLLFPGHGIFVEASYTEHRKILGSSSRFGRLVLDVTSYHRLKPWAVLALNSYNSFVNGDAPFQQLSLLGGSRRMRGYYEGRYMDKNMAVLQAEARVNVYRRFGFAVFGGVAALGNNTDFLRLHDPKYSYGAGLRYTFNKRDHMNVRLDYGMGPGTSGFYFTVGEAF